MARKHAGNELLSDTAPPFSLSTNNLSASLTRSAAILNLRCPGFSASPEKGRSKTRLGAGRQLVRVRGALVFAVVVVLADASRRQRVGRQREEERKEQPQRHVAQPVEVLAKALGAADHGAPPGAFVRASSFNARRRQGPMRRIASTAKAASSTSAMGHEVVQLRQKAAGRGEARLEPHDQVQVVHQMEVAAAVGELQLHGQQALQLGAVPFGSVGDLCARHGRDADAVLQFGRAQAGHDAVDAFQRALDHLQATLGQPRGLVGGVAVHEGLVGTGRARGIARHGLRAGVAAQRGSRSRHWRRRHTALRTAWLSSNTTLYWHTR